MQSVSEAHSTYIEWGQSLDQGGCRGFSLCAPSPFPAPFRVVMSHPNPVPFGQVPVIVTLIDPRSGVERSRRRSKGKGRGTNIERSKQRERSEGGPERMLGKPENKRFAALGAKRRKVLLSSSPLHFAYRWE